MESMPHTPVLLEAALEALAIRPDGRYVDGTFGRGGHSRGILSRLGPKGQLLAMDRDPSALEASGQLAADPRFSFRQESFSHMAEVIRQHWPDGGVDGVLLDLGVSSPQLDEPSRGFSFQHDGPLDMRMDPGTGIPVSEWLNRADEAAIADVLHTLGEERFSRRIARAIVAARRTAPLTRTRELADLVRRAVPRSEPGRHPATRTFQALRIHINDELGELRTWLDTIPDVLVTGARLAVISFHSLEDRLVKRAFQGRSDAPRPPRGLPILPEATRPRLRMVGKPVRPDAAECQRNPRARSAVLRVGERNP
ncbi:16S rRNA (cytosine(1402)-N(4))-methyltransferase RsmH [Thioalkalivibrio sp.]|uniref:16S rRNA (cytosine(1402)-N(4))-methyltransferase RsmH n=1 Tax=Thioalkalivibrio sp. TaxID=2093813 RepID=UPI0012D6CC61|nr:16S rRNA (cytosine(1402)-N(4))-methyltransferase RsmH [Thioalkalivibrio sp.]TVP79620.1 MAG: 16S rRNA (cytosine(1402)-N(4))-methyltransferase RsmH [Thioalkalivibrio sp.]